MCFPCPTRQSAMAISVLVTSQKAQQNISKKMSIRRENCTPLPIAVSNSLWFLCRLIDTNRFWASTEEKATRFCTFDGTDRLLKKKKDTNRRAHATQANHHHHPNLAWHPIRSSFPWRYLTICGMVTTPAPSSLSSLSLVQSLATATRSRSSRAS